ncbi:hypothetical protein HNP55_002090 [Paucibacter oligotrophus]|uniref:Glycosyltransferase 2-like domain-containing protein n=1 Tax=Roseateles oligotrophus TaxID=1769250 RepID=A0A840LE23_9BURK|nr:glycosyltransferase family 2 protein [Roseateles oligotrophus]MBB4843567.1 hypothetical protein [Roseateles oligotrophus]
MSASLPLSVCLIVRDEAHNLPLALASVQGLAHEIIVVDTGSVDNSPAIAAAWGARVLHWAWQDDFALARNQALAAASCDWILSLDADQQLAPASLPALRQALGRQDCLAQLVQVQLLSAAADARANPLGDGRAIAPLQSLQALRLFRRDPRIRFEGRVHEDVAESLLRMGSSHWPDSGLTLFDHGYVQASERARKRERNLALLRLSQAENPEGLYLGYKLAISLPPEQQAQSQALLERAMEQVMRLPAQEFAKLPFLPRLVASAVQAWTEQGQLMRAARCCLALQPQLPGLLDFCTGRALARAGLAEQARPHLLAALQGFALPPKDADLWLRDLDASPAACCLWLAWNARQQGLLAEAAEWIEQGCAQATPRQQIDLACEGLEIQLAAGELTAAAGTLDLLGGWVREQGYGMDSLLRVSAKLAQASGDLATALLLARDGAGSDAAAALLASLEIANSPLDEERLRQHYQAISGQCYDSLAVKLLIGEALGQAWPHEAPTASLALMRGA